MTDELARECAKIREAYPWLEDSRVQFFAELVIKNRHKNDTNSN